MKLTSEQLTVLKEFYEMLHGKAVQYNQNHQDIKIILKNHMDIVIKIIEESNHEDIQ